MKQIESIAVYCGASTGNKVSYQTATKELAQWLVKNHLALVYGGGGFGLMGILGSTVLALGGQVHGVIPQELYDRGTALPQLKDLTVVADMSTRKKTMLAKADACIALPGGPGTLEEIAGAFSWALLGDNANPCVFYNVAGYFDSLERFFDEMVQAGFLSKNNRAALFFSDSLAEIWDFMQAYQTPEIRKY